MSNELDPTATPPVVDALAQLSFAVLTVLTRCSAEHDLSVTQLRMLGILRDREPTMAALASYLGLDRSSVTGLIDRAEKRGLVERRPSDTDARVTTVTLTAGGRELGAALAQRVEAGVESLLTAVSAADRARLVRVTEAIAAASA